MILPRDNTASLFSSLAVGVKTPKLQPLPLPILLPPLTAVQAGQQVSPAAAKIQQLGLPSWNLDRCPPKYTPLI